MARFLASGVEDFLLFFLYFLNYQLITPIMCLHGNYQCTNYVITRSYITASGWQIFGGIGGYEWY